ncbi:MAG: hypothetical protein JF616_21260 [Fibrobacteres bacterium]|jgi:hypothetical protein|nr:hypothetical protein [Fibrobacterota bacterium]
MPPDSFFKPLGEIDRRLGTGPRPKSSDAVSASIGADAFTPEGATPVAPAPEKPKPKSARLFNPKWEAQKVGFNEESPISVELELPPEVAHKQRVTFELFAKTPKGPERISQGEAMAEDGNNLRRV